MWRFCFLICLFALCNTVFLTSCQKPAEKPSVQAEETTDGSEASEEEEAPAEAPPQKPKEDTRPLVERVQPITLTLPTSSGLQLKLQLFEPSQLHAPPTPVDLAAAEDEETPEAVDEDAEGIKPKVKPVYKGPKYPVVVLLHGLSSTGTSWKPLAVALIQAGCLVLVPDMPGHGDSTQWHATPTMPATTKSWRAFSEPDWLQGPQDISDALVSLFQQRQEFPQANFNRVALVGAGLHANTALLASDVLSKVRLEKFKQAPITIRALALLSPTLDSKGLQTGLPAALNEAPTLLMVSQEDVVATQDTLKLYRILHSPKTLWEFKNLGNGQDMLVQKPALQAKLVNWLKEKLF